MRFFENVAKHPIITIVVLLALNLGGVLALFLVFPVHRVLNGEQIDHDNSPDFLPERYDHSTNAEYGQHELDQRLKTNSNNRDPALVGIYDRLGDSYLGESNYERAVQNYDKAISLRWQLHLPDDDEKARTLIGLAAAHQGLGNYDSSEKAAIEALNIRERLFPARTQVFVALMRLAGIYHTAGKTEKCIQTYKRAAVLADSQHDWNLMQQAEKRLAEHLEGADRLNEAETQMRNAVELSEKINGKDNIANMKDLTLLAEILQREKKYGEADKVFARAFSLVKNCNYDDLIDLNCSYIIYLLDQKKEQEAQRAFEAFLSEVKTRFKDTPQYVVDSLDNLHSRLYVYNSTPLGLKIAQVTLAESNKHFGENSDQSLRLEGTLARGYVKSDFAKADKLFQEAIKKADASLGIKNWVREDLHESYAGNLAAHKDYAKADSEYLTALKHSEASDHYINARVLGARAANLAEWGKQDQAIEVYRSAMAESKKDSNSNDSDLKYALGVLLNRSKNYTEALPLLQESVEEYVKNRAFDYAFELDKPLLECYAKLGKTQESSEYKKKAQEAFQKELQYEIDCFGANSLKVAGKEKEYADILYRYGKFSDAKAHYEKATALNKKLKGDKEFDTECAASIESCDKAKTKSAD